MFRLSLSAPWLQPCPTKASIPLKMNFKICTYVALLFNYASMYADCWPSSSVADSRVLSVGYWLSGTTVVRFSSRKKIRLFTLISVVTMLLWFGSTKFNDVKIKHNIIITYFSCCCLRIGFCFVGVVCRSKLWSSVHSSASVVDKYPQFRIKLKGRIRIRIIDKLDPDPHHSGKLDPDPHQSY